MDPFADFTRNSQLNNAFDSFGDSMSSALPTAGSSRNSNSNSNSSSNNNDEFDFFGAPAPAPAPSRPVAPPVDDFFASFSPAAAPSPAPPPRPPVQSSGLDDFFGSGPASTDPWGAPSPPPGPPPPPTQRVPSSAQRQQQVDSSYDDFFNAPSSSSSSSSAPAPSVRPHSHSASVPSHSNAVPSSRPSSKSVASSARPPSDDEADDCDDEEEDKDFGAADMSMFHVPASTRPASKSSAASKRYSVRFDHEQKLGVLLERCDSWVNGTGGKAGLIREGTVVKLVVENGAADVKGVKLHSKVVAINDIDCEELPYLETLNLVKSTARPMTMTLELGNEEDGETIYGRFLYQKSVFEPMSFSSFKTRWIVLGGAVANKNVLQLYKSKADYEKVVVSLFDGRGIDVKLKAYKLVPGFKVTPLKSMRFVDGPMITMFSIMVPGANFKSVKFASEDTDTIQKLYNQVTVHAPVRY